MNQSSQVKSEYLAPSAGLVLGGILLLVALSRLPYGYYVLMRWIVSGACFYGAWYASKNGQEAWAWGLGALGLLFNPIVPLRMHRSEWRIFDIIGAVVMFVASGALSKHVQREA